jgi:predicted phage baseplate assembly protein
MTPNDPRPPGGSCGCCEGLSPRTPAPAGNRPGLARVAYRPGTYAEFKATLLARLSSAHKPALEALKTRDDDDFAIALLDVWAVMCDVLTFYQERIANESYLRTATELLSVVELARLIDYRLQPGVAASTDIAFTMEDAPGALGQALGTGDIVQKVPGPPLRIVLGAGIKVQSIPGPGEAPVTFETVSQVEARAEWNAMRPRLRQPQPLLTSASGVVLEGTATNLKPGDALLVVAGPSARTLKRVVAVVPDEKAKVTRVDFTTTAFAPPPFEEPTLTPATSDELSAAAPLTDQQVETSILGRSWDLPDLEAAIAVQRWDPADLATMVSKLTQGSPSTGSTGVFAMRLRAAPFGHNAPAHSSLSPNLRIGAVVATSVTETKFETGPYVASWESNTLATSAGTQGNLIDLDTSYPGIAKGSWIVLVGTPETSGATTDQALEVTDTAEVTRSAFTITAKVSRLTVSLTPAPTHGLSQFHMRRTTVLGGSERLALAQLPLVDLVQDARIVLDRLVLGLRPGQVAVVTGERADMTGVRASERLVLKRVLVEDGFTLLELEKALAHAYRRDTVTINANVAPATHGESVDEVLGSGDGSAPFQRFTLKQPPLTHTSAPTVSGVESTLEVRVNDVRWHETETLLRAAPSDRVFVTRTDADGNTTVVFGDGKAGARLPTGAENARARYRKGIGAAGNLAANRLTQLLTRPLGLKEATNPVPATGGADPEQLADARVNAPIGVLTLGRIVSLQDYEDFARGFPGIAKSRATWTWTGTIRGVFLTVAGVNGAEVASDAPLYANLLGALQTSGDPTVPIRLDTYRPRFFRVEAGIKVHPDYLPARVLEAVTGSLRRQFGFAARQFGQPVAKSEVIAAMQDVEGVVFVDLSVLSRTDTDGGLAEALEAAMPQPGTRQPVAAELLLLDPRPIALEVLS